MRLFLVRHAQSKSDIEAIVQEPSEKLSSVGRRQAEAVAERLFEMDDSFVQLYSSPMPRAVETANAIGRRLMLTPFLLQDLRSLDCGEAEGLTFDQAHERWPDVKTAIDAGRVDWRWPGGEIASEFRTRAVDCVNGIIERFAGKNSTVIVVGHGGPFSWTIAHLLKEEHVGWPPYRVPNCAIIQIDTNSETRLLSIDTSVNEQLKISN